LQPLLFYTSNSLRCQISVANIVVKAIFNRVIEHRYLRMPGVVFRFLRCLQMNALSAFLLRREDLTITKRNANSDFISVEEIQGLAHQVKIEREREREKLEMLASIHVFPWDFSERFP
jgi:hypothetical protein